MKNEWVKYTNGNYCVYFNKSNGTKIRRCDEDVLKPEFPENIDVLTSTKCDMECPWCYAVCRKGGKHCDFSKYTFFDTIHPYTEIALNMNFPMHPGLPEFLGKMKEKQVFVNLTVNEKHFVEHYEEILEMKYNKLFCGLGISVNGIPNEDFMCKIKTMDNTVLHVINGIFDDKCLDVLKDNKLKILILGYKHHGRGIKYNKTHDTAIQKKKEWLEMNFDTVMNSFDVVSFDNLALKQLKIKSKLSEEGWKTHYMGDDATVTFAIDLVNGTFSPNSISEEHYPIKDNVSEMLNIIRK